MTNPSRRALIAGNWKMNNTVRECVALALAVSAQGRPGPRTDVVLAPMFTALLAVSEALKGTGVAVAAQDVHWEEAGAFTGEVSAAMLEDAGCTYCLVGHSERRHGLGETDQVVYRKLQALLRHGLTPIACVGETLAEREGGITYQVLGRQLDALLEGASEAVFGGVVLAYEPVWAIGTGRTASPRDAQTAHAFLRDRVRHRLADAADRVRILYGGSAKADNAAELLAQPDVDGLLVGGASLDAASFARIIQAAG
ncbi:MAG: triose-phosphate isomerase [Deltaproteobacteria bacterium]|nr:triose-phosphate isomerase [Deltaproteobacteria bacterium]